MTIHERRAHWVISHGDASAVMSTCGHSTGSITGCRPLCSDPATVEVLTFSGYPTPTRSARCARHVAAVVNAAWPYRTATRPITEEH